MKEALCDSKKRIAKFKNKADLCQQDSKRYRKERNAAESELQAVVQEKAQIALVLNKSIKLVYQQDEELRDVKLQLEKAE